VRLFKEVIKHWDCTILCGHRGKELQNEYFHQGLSKKEFPNSMHNGTPSLAVDVAPYPIDWEDTRRIYMFVGFVRGIAAIIDVPIRCGADWDGDMQVKDQNFHDTPHFEYVGEDEYTRL
jgi:peptidoglycan L-alanyl-D-glutamate endopeptidase CwlK